MDIYFMSRSGEPSAVIAEDDNASIYIFLSMIGSAAAYHTTDKPAVTAHTIFRTLAVPAHILTK